MGITSAVVGERNGNPLQYSCLQNPMDREAWWATVPGVSKSQTRLSNKLSAVVLTLLFVGGPPWYGSLPPVSLWFLLYTFDYRRSFLLDSRFYEVSLKNKNKPKRILIFFFLSLINDFY